MCKFWRGNSGEKLAYRNQFKGLISVGFANVPGMRKKGRSVVMGIQGKGCHCHGVVYTWIVVGHSPAPGYVICSGTAERSVAKQSQSEGGFETHALVSCSTSQLT